MTDYAARLRSAGMSAFEAGEKAALFVRCEVALGARPEFAFFVPGRIEVLGKHTDYAGGRSLLCAMERGFVVVAAPRDDDRVNLTDVMHNELRELSMDPDLDATRGDWSNYVAAVIRSVTRHFPSARRGVDVAFASDLPPASGMSSSSALIIATFMVLRAVNDLENDPLYRQVITSREVLGEYLGAVENGRSFGPFDGDRGVGTLGGSQDQTAIICCRAGALSRYSWCPVTAEGAIALADDLVFAVAYSGVSAEKTASAMEAYNAVSLSALRIVHLWNETNEMDDQTLGEMIAWSPEVIGAMRELLAGDAALSNRFDQFVSETYDIIPAAEEALAAGDMDSFGTLVDQSQRGAEDLLGNQVPETIALARLARKHGAIAASAFGAGFGGSVWAMLRAHETEGFLDAWARAYQEAFPIASEHAMFFTSAAGPGALRL